MCSEFDSLTKKYKIPLSHLDFNYIKNCEDGGEMEKIVHILRSGQEGYYPDLMKSAEEKLKKLRPNSKQFRYEEHLLTKHTMERSEYENQNKIITDWSNDVKVKDNFLSTIANSKNEELEEIIPPIRHKMKKVSLTEGLIKDMSKVETNTSVERIKSTDYNKWDKYDPDTEVLKMELEEERNREKTERLNKKNDELRKQSYNKIELTNKNIIDKLTNIEKENFSSMHKHRGNDYFKVKEYENAIIEYSKSLEYFETAAGYNNRAIAYLKLLKYCKCIDDCNKCLGIEPKNIKALLRQGQAFMELQQSQNAYEVYVKIISIEPSNKIAIENLNILKHHLPNMPPITATRIKIQEDCNQESIKSEEQNVKNISNNTIKENHMEENKKELTKKELNQNEKMKKENAAKDNREEYEDLSKLIMPKKFKKNKFASTFEKMKDQNLIPKCKSKAKNDNKKIAKNNEEIKLLLNNDKQTSNRPLIEEIN